MLRRVWLTKDLRRHGLVSAAWPLWRDRYGEFKVSAPNASMKAFLRSGVAQESQPADATPQI
jgi:hypothetical protein